jgi:hypothetical protein
MGVRGLSRAPSREVVSEGKLDQQYMEICHTSTHHWPHLYLQHHAERLNQLYRVLKTKLQRRRPLRKTSTNGAGATSEISEQARSVAKGLGSEREAQQFTMGTVLFGLLVFLTGAAPGAVPYMFITFFAICMPWRIVSFSQRKYGFYLIDFCYFANLATLLYLLCYPTNANIGAMVYALCDGPLAGALIVWQCAWVLGSADYTISALMHLLPGLAIFTHQHYPSIHGWRAALAYSKQQLSSMGSSAGASQPLQPSPLPAAALAPCSTSTWLLAAPLAFYLTWQLLYYVTVQLCCRRYILATGQETSYIGLAKRAAKTNNVWNRLVRRGSATRRCLLYGLLQLTFTLGTLGVFYVVHRSFLLQLAWQMVKFVVPLHYGSRYQCQKVPQYTFLEGVRRLQREQQAQEAQEALSAAAMSAAAAEQEPAAAAAVGMAATAVSPAAVRAKRSRSSRRRA